MKTFSIILTAAITAILFAAGCVNEEPAYKQRTRHHPCTGGRHGLSVDGRHDDARHLRRPRPTRSPTTRQAKRSSPRRAPKRHSPMSMNSSSRSSTPKARRSTRTRMPICKPKRSATDRQDGASDGQLQTGGPFGRNPPRNSPSGTIRSISSARDFAIEKNEDTVLEEIVCTLSNIKVTLTCSKDLADQFTAETISTVSLGETSMVFIKGETRAAYFTSLRARAQHAQVATSTGAFAETPETHPSSSTRSIPNVKAGQWRKITLVITYCRQGRDQIRHRRQRIS